jgi:hypothetical protein
VPTTFANPLNRQLHGDLAGLRKFQRRFLQFCELLRRKCAAALPKGEAPLKNALKTDPFDGTKISLVGR